MDMTILDDTRAATVHFMQHDRNSPLTEEQKRSGLALMYYEENPALRFSLDLEPYDTQETVEMQTSPRDVASYLRWGRLSFEMGTVRAQLTVYKDPEGRGYLVPFADATSGIETYGAGWYRRLRTSRTVECWSISTMRITRTARTTNGGTVL